MLSQVFLLHLAKIIDETCRRNEVTCVSAGMRDHWEQKSGFPGTYKGPEEDLPKSLLKICETEAHNLLKNVVQFSEHL